MKKLIAIIITAFTLSACVTNQPVDPRIAKCAAEGKVLKRDNSGITRCNVDFDISEQLRPSDIQTGFRGSVRRAAN